MVCICVCVRRHTHSLLRPDCIKQLASYGYFVCKENLLNYALILLIEYEGSCPHKNFDTKILTFFVCFVSHVEEHVSYIIHESLQ